WGGCRPRHGKQAAVAPRLLTVACAAELSASAVVVAAEPRRVRAAALVHAVARPARTVRTPLRRTTAPSERATNRSRTPAVASRRAVSQAVRATASRARRG